MTGLSLKIEVDKKSGFCFGVVNAIEIAEEYLKKNDKLYCLGSIVHNKMEIQRLENLGMITIHNDEYKKLKNETVLLRAHGEPPETFITAKENNIKLINATCVIVNKLQKKIIELKKLSLPIFIFGNKKHPEIIGLNGQIKNEAVIFSSLKELKEIEIPQRMILLSQTTKDVDEFYEIKEFLLKKEIVVDFHNTICTQVVNRKYELKDFSKRNDKIVFVAGRNSSNGKVLYGVSKNHNPNTFFITDTDELKKSWFNKNEKVGISGATSTPVWLIEKVKRALEDF